MKPTIRVTEAGDIDSVRKALASLSQARVYVGIPEAETSRNGEVVTNAGLMYIHTNGSTLKGIPPRPVIEPAIEANKDIITKELGLAATSEMEGDREQTVLHLKRAGTLGANAAKRWFTDPRNNWAPLSTNPLGSFLAEKVSESLKTEVTADMSYAEAKEKSGFNQTLIITGELRRSITHVEEI